MELIGANWFDNLQYQNIVTIEMFSDELCNVFKKKKSFRSREHI